MLKDVPAAAAAPAEKTTADVVENRRASYRARLGCYAILRGNGPRPAGTGITVNVNDVSLHGVGFRSPQALNVGDVWRFTIPESQNHQGRLIEIIFCRARGTAFMVGAKFC